MERLGGCLCGNVRYSVSGDSLVNALCHCPSCRRASGAPVVAFAIFPIGAMHVTSGDPVVYESSPGVRRAFCGQCGTPLWCDTDEYPEYIDMTVNSLDEPEEVRPQMNIWHKYAMDWMSDIDSLKTLEGDVGSDDSDSSDSNESKD